MPKKISSKITLDKLGQMVQRGFSETKDDIQRVEARLGERIEKLEKEIDYGFSVVAQTIKRLHEEIKAMDYTVEIHDLRARMERVERKIGLKR